MSRNLTDLHERVHRGAYRALPSRRTYIPKADGRQRPLAVAALEDKIVQRATVAVLNAIYEEDFLGFSYGFRPKRGQHDALDALAVGISSKRVNFILDADVASFFDSVSHEWLVRFVEHRIGDPRIIRLIQKWLKAGVLEDGVVTVSESGTGQGSVISPLLANVYLHYVFDLWAERWRRREATGDMIIVRYADDIVVGFEHETDARRFRDAMRERLQEFSLSLTSGEDPPDRVWSPCGGQTRSARARKTGDLQASWASPTSAVNPAGANSSSSGRTRRDRMRAKLTEIKEELRRRMHQPIPEQGQWLAQVVRGFFAYHAVPTNFPALRAFRHHVTVSGCARYGVAARRIARRGSGSRRSLDDYLPQPRILHPWPQHALRRHTPKVGAVCGNSARTVLCGGRSVMTVPTANISTPSKRFPLFPRLRTYRCIARADALASADSCAATWYARCSPIAQSCP